MRISLIVLLLLAVAGCGQPERLPEARDQAAEQAEQPQPQTPTVAADEPQGQQQPYGLGAPWPEAAIDEEGRTLLNQLELEFAPDVGEARASFLIDSIAQSLNAAVRKLDMDQIVQYSFRWSQGREHDRDSIITRLKELPEVSDVWPTFLVSSPRG